MADSTRLRCGVIGTGYLGALHASKYAAHPDCELIAVYDVDADRAQAVASSNDCAVADSLEALLAQVDAVSIAVPTVDHADVAIAARLPGPTPRLPSFRPTPPAPSP